MSQSVRDENAGACHILKVGRPADWFWHTLPGRLAKYDHHVIGANWSVDERQPWRGYGFSTIYAAGGIVLSTAKSIYGDEIVYADLEIRPALW